MRSWLAEGPRIRAEQSGPLWSGCCAGRPAGLRSRDLALTVLGAGRRGQAPAGSWHEGPLPGVDFCVPTGWGRRGPLGLYKAPRVIYDLLTCKGPASSASPSASGFQCECGWDTARCHGLCVGLIFARWSHELRDDADDQGRPSVFPPRFRVRSCPISCRSPVLLS